MPCFTSKLIHPTTSFGNSFSWTCKQPCHITSIERLKIEIEIRQEPLSAQKPHNTPPYETVMQINRGYFFNTRLPVACILITFWHEFLPLGHDPSVFGTEHYYPLIVRSFAAHYSQRQKRPTRIREGTHARTCALAHLHSSAPRSARTYARSPNLQRRQLPSESFENLLF